MPTQLKLSNLPFNSTKTKNMLFYALYFVYLRTLKIHT